MVNGFQFADKAYQTAAVDAVVACFEGQPEQPRSSVNAQVALDGDDLLRNIRRQQMAEKLPLSGGLSEYATAAPINLDIEMETGTGKTLVYLRTMMELNRTYGWSRYIVVVPSIAIREGVKQTLADTREYLKNKYGSAPVSHVYKSDDLMLVERFAENDGKVHVLVINAQAFNRDQEKSTGQRDATKRLKLFREDLEDFQGRRPIDLIADTRPILLIDEPQRLGGDPNRPSATLKALKSFNALCALRYSATHKVEHNLVYRLDARDAYRHKLVKQVVVTGLEAATTVGAARIEMLSAERRDDNRVATLRVDRPSKSGSQQIRVEATVGKLLRELTKPANTEYGDLRVSDIDVDECAVELSNGDRLTPVDLGGRSLDEKIRGWQIGRVIDMHLEREQALFPHGVKVLSLFFIDEVSKYKDYSRNDRRGVYARIFEREYKKRAGMVLERLVSTQPYDPYVAYLRDRMNASESHDGYFSKNAGGQFVDGGIDGRGENQGHSKDAAAYDLILKNKRRLLSFDEPVRFIFSHSALREGWDNPNVFAIGTLKRSDNQTSRRQEIGRGLRIAVDQGGRRLEPPHYRGDVHDLNVLHVVTDESYTAFVRGLQGEGTEGRASQRLDPRFFEGRTLVSASSASGDKELPSRVVSSEEASRLRYWLIREGLVNHEHLITEEWEARALSASYPGPDFPEGLEPYLPAVEALIEGGARGEKVPLDSADLVPNLRVPERFDAEAFRSLWAPLSRTSWFDTAAFDSGRLVDDASAELNRHLVVTPPRLNVRSMVVRPLMGTVSAAADDDRSETVEIDEDLRPRDVVGEIAFRVGLTRATIVNVLQRLAPEKFAFYRVNPTQFIRRVADVIVDHKAAGMVAAVNYHVRDISEALDGDKVFPASDKEAKRVSRETPRPRKSVLEYLPPLDSAVERWFALGYDKPGGDARSRELRERFDPGLDSLDEVLAWAKLPKPEFSIATPLGAYTPDWAVAARSPDGGIDVYLVIETKSTTRQGGLRPDERLRIIAAEEHFRALGRALASEGDGLVARVHYHHVDSLSAVRDRIKGLSVRSTMVAGAWEGE